MRGRVRVPKVLVPLDVNVVHVVVLAGHEADAGLVAVLLEGLGEGHPLVLLQPSLQLVGDLPLRPQLVRVRAQVQRTVLLQWAATTSWLWPVSAWRSVAP